MTFLEKFQKEHPELNIKDWRDIPDSYFSDTAKCPKDLGYETLAEGISACDKYWCDECWDREIPNTEPSSETKTETKTEPKTEPSHSDSPSSENVLIMLTKSQCKNLKEFLEFEFINSVRRDRDVDNMEYIADMGIAYNELKKALEQ